MSTTTGRHRARESVRRAVRGSPWSRRRVLHRLLSYPNEASRKEPWGEIRHPLGPALALECRYLSLQLLEGLFSRSHLQGIDNLFKLSRHHQLQFIQGEVDPVVGQAVLWIIVGTDPFRTVSGADLALAVVGPFA